MGATSPRYQPPQVVFGLPQQVTPRGDDPHRPPQGGARGARGGELVDDEGRRRNSRLIAVAALSGAIQVVRHGE